MIFSLLPILSLLVRGVEVDEKDEATMLQLVGQVKSGLGGSAAMHDLDPPFLLYLTVKPKSRPPASAHQAI